MTTLLTLLLAQATTNPEPLERPRWQTVCYETGDRSSCARARRRATVRHPRQADAVRYGTALAWTLGGHLDEGDALIEEILTEEPELTPSLRSWQAIGHEQAGELESARALYTGLLDHEVFRELAREGLIRCGGPI